MAADLVFTCFLYLS